jgi:hypothetical protein
MNKQRQQALKECVLFLLNFHRGRDQAISRDEFLHQLAMHGFADVKERKLRVMIHELRAEGNLICSSGGLTGGYWCAAGWDDVEEYFDREVRARALDLLEQEKILRHAAGIEFGPKPVPDQLVMLPFSHLRVPEYWKLEGSDVP